MSGGTTRAQRPRARASVTSVLGELLITAGIVALLYVAWQMWVGDWIIGNQANAGSGELVELWESEQPTVHPDPEPSEPAEPVLLPQPRDGKKFAVMRVPRFGDDYKRTIAGGVTKATTLDKNMIGHYPGTQMPGQEGNFALAAHRTTYGAPFGPIADLRVGDAIVIETKQGWYTYRFRTLEYVKPGATDVLDPVPQKSSTPSSERYITLTSCSPRFSNVERVIAYGVFDSFQPRSAGKPSSLASVKGA
ncbi:MAG: class E sortase [Microbacterium sp.]|uniref:class E sortase n=1 Tax=Microbacterium sp. TaxID=51671 RepID=UPI0039E49A91